MRNDLNMFVYKLQTSIDDEWAAYNFYTKLMESTNDEFFRSLIDHARMDEKKHYNDFQKLHYKLTGKYYTNNEKIESVTNFKEGIRKAFEDELEAAEKYRKMMFEIPDDEDYEPLLNAMHDETEHAIRFSTIYNAI
ncbi:MAG: ferritin-like protein [Bacillales bacterium]|jgi:rubrerythrin|nr:ferritin-like protein [Bacillales bacterium]